MAKPEDYTVTRAYLGRIPETRKLYKLEEKVAAAVKEAAKEWLKVMDRPESDFWTVGLPSELWTLLDGFDRHASAAACREFLRKYDETMAEVKAKKEKESGVCDDCRSNGPQSKCGHWGSR